MSGAQPGEPVDDLREQLAMVLEALLPSSNYASRHLLSYDLADAAIRHLAPPVAGDLLERIARIMCEHYCGSYWEDDVWTNLEQQERGVYLSVADEILAAVLAGDLRERIMFAIGAIQERNYETGRIGVLDLDPVEVADAVLAVLAGERPE